MIRKLADGKFRLYSRKKIRAPVSDEISGPFRRGERRYCTSVRSSISSDTERDRSSYPWCATPSSSSPRSRISGTMRSSSSSRCRINPFSSVALASA